MSAGPRRFVGRSIPRLEDQRLLRGAGRYTDDLPVDQGGAPPAYAAFVRSPHAHARLLGIDPRAALQLPGVLAVLTGADYLADGGRGIQQAPVPADALDVRRPAFDTALDLPQLPLATDTVRYPGEAVAVVLAASAALAADAVELVEVAYAPLPAVVDVRTALAPDAPMLWPAAGSNVGVDATFGQPEATRQAFEQAEVVVELEVASQRVVNAQLEPRAATAVYDPTTDSYTMVAGSQGVTRQRAALAAALGVPSEHVRVISPDVGGGFGPRSNLYPEQVIVAWASRRLGGRPVRWTSTRSEAFSSDLQGRDARTTARLALTSAGRILALDADWLLNVGAQPVSYVPLANAARILTSVYAIPALCVRQRAVLTNTVPTGPYRGAGRPEAILALERLLDLAARRLGIDRLALRRQNLIDHTQLPYTTATGLVYDSGKFRQAMDRAAELADWSGFAERRADAQRRGRLAGIGLANYVEAPVGAPNEQVHLQVLADGSIELRSGTQSTGQGHATTFAQVVADELGVLPEQVHLVTGDTAASSGGGTHSDRSMRLAGTLITEAAQRLREQCIELAAELLGAEPSRLTFADGAVADGHGRLSLAELAQRAPIVSEASFTGRIPAYPTGAAVCEVEIDPETGRLELTRYTCVDDVGQPVNPRIVEGQIHGGIVQGLGQALSEATAYDPSNGQPLVGTFLDYALPRANGLPRLQTELFEDPTAGNPLRIKGGGEGGITPCLAAVTNAAVDALAAFGISHLDPPLTPARLGAAISRGTMSSIQGVV